MLTKREKRIIENELITTINGQPNGIDTRVLISGVFTSVSRLLPKVNRHHIAGMLSYVYRSYDLTFLVRTAGHSVIQ